MLCHLMFVRRYRGVCRYKGAYSMFLTPRCKPSVYHTGLQQRIFPITANPSANSTNPHLDAITISLMLHVASCRSFSHANCRLDLAKPQLCRVFNTCSSPHTRRQTYHDLEGISRTAHTATLKPQAFRCSAINVMAVNDGRCY